MKTPIDSSRQVLVFVEPAFSAFSSNVANCVGLT
jgi:hypothetical protein